MLQDDPKLYEPKTNPPWWRQQRAGEIRRQIGDPRLQFVLKRDEHVWDLLAEARHQRFHPMYDRDVRYAALKAEAQRLLEVFAREHRSELSNSLLDVTAQQAYAAVIAAIGALLPPDVHDLVTHGDLTEEEAKELERPYLVEAGVDDDE